jgi:putative endonuclease
MNAERSYYVYILASRHHGTLYIGVTNDIRTRLEQHRSGRGSKFVQQHKVSVSFTWKHSRHRKKPSRARSS